MNIAERIRAMDAEGYSRAEICRAVERTPQYIGAIIHAHRKREAAGRKGLTVKVGRPKKEPPPGELASGSEGRQS